MSLGQMGKMFLLLAVWAILWALLASMSRCNLACGFSCQQEKTAPEIPHCSAMVTRYQGSAGIAIEGTIAGGGEVVVVVAPAESNRLSRSNFKVEETFQQSVDYAVTAQTNFIPMIFMFTRDGAHQYVCRLRFLHEDRSPFTPEELDAIERTKSAVASRRQ